MAQVENGFITFSKSEVTDLIESKICPKCTLSFICRGPDSKTNSAEIHPTIRHDPTDKEIARDASCLK